MTDKNVDDLIENFEFKAITEGLGFHHGLEDEDQVETSLKKKSESLARDLNNRSKLLREKNKTSKPVSMGELAPFYQDEAENTPIFKTEELEIVEEIKEEVMLASSVRRFCAYIVDLFLITLLVVSYSAGVYVAAGITLSNLDLVFTPYFYQSVAITFFLFYLFYFTFMDTSYAGSIGKRVCGLRLTTIYSEKPSLKDSFLRSNLSLFSLLTIGMISLLKMDQKLLDTKVIKK